MESHRFERPDECGMHIFSVLASFGESLSLIITREVPSTVATAIAEDKLDPCTMEAFDHFSSDESNLYLKISTRACAQLPSQQAIASPTEKGGFVAISSCKLRKEAKRKYPLLHGKIFRWNFYCLNFEASKTVVCKQSVKHYNYFLCFLHNFDTSLQMF